MEDFIKIIFVEKKYFELNQKEKSMISDWAENEEEFDALKLTFLSSESIRKEMDAELSPSVKERLNERFSAKYAEENEIWWNKILMFFFPGNTQFLKKPAFKLAMVALTVALVIPFLWQNKSPQYAMNQDVENLKLETVEFSEKEIEVQLKGLVRKENSNQKEKEESLSEDIVPQVLSDSRERFREIKIEPSLDPNAKLLDQRLNLDEITIQRDDIVEEFSVASPAPTSISPKTYSNNYVQQPELLKITSDKDLIAQGKNAIPKEVEVSETMDLLTALY